MDATNIRTLAQYIAQQRSRDRHYNGASQHPAFDTTTEDDSHWSQGPGSGDERPDSDSQG